jgi:type IV secretion system protein VirB6
MNGSCAFADDMGVVRNMLAAVDCNARHFSMLGYQSLTGSHAFETAFTACLTIYVAILGYRLLFAPDGMRLSDGPGIALKIGAVVALVTSWSLFQTLVFDVATRAPLEIAGLLSAPTQDNSALAADPISGLQEAYDQLSGTAVSLGKAAGSAGQVFANHKGESAELLVIAAGVLLFGCAGLIAVIVLAIAILTVVGPLFITLFLFFETRGLFVGWVRALSAVVFAFVSTWTLIVLMLQVFEPWLRELAQQNDAGALDEQTATTAAAIVFVFAACQLLMIIAGFVVASGFSVSRKVRSERTSERLQESIREAATPAVLSRPAWLAEQLQKPGAIPSRVAATSLATSFRAMPATVVARPAGGTDFYRRPFQSYADRQGDGDPT